MARNEKRRQKRLLKKRQKDKVRQRASAGVYVAGPGRVRMKVREARNLPVHECLINPSWRKRGLAHILISRRQPSGSLVIAAYLVDVWCLGLKSTFCNADLPQFRYESDLRAKMYRDERPAKCPLPLAHQIIYGAIEFAAQFGFTPDKDFRLSRYVLEERDPIEPWDDLQFGKNGKPFYVSGPHDDPARIIRQLEATAGPGNFDVMIGGPMETLEEAAGLGPVVFL